MEILIWLGLCVLAIAYERRKSAALREELATANAALEAYRARPEITTYTCGHCRARLGDSTTTREDAFALYRDHAKTCEANPYRGAA